MGAAHSHSVRVVVAADIHGMLVVGWAVAAVAGQVAQVLEDFVLVAMNERKYYSCNYKLVTQHYSNPFYRELIASLNQ